MMPRITPGQKQYGYAKCAGCLMVIPLDEFNQWREGRDLFREKSCKECVPVLSQPVDTPRIKRSDSYLQNCEIIRLAKDKPCADCGHRFHPVCMDFDHRVAGEKAHNVAALKSRNPAILRAEIDKCDVVCSNCHRIRTHGRNYEGTGRPKIKPSLGTNSAVLGSE